MALLSALVGVNPLLRKRQRSRTRLCLGVLKQPELWFYGVHSGVDMLI